MKQLSSSERALVTSLIDGMPIPGIAQQLGRPVHEIDRRIRLVYDKLGVSDRRELRAATPQAPDFVDVPAALAEAQSLLRTLLQPRGVLEVDYEIDYFEVLEVVIVLTAKSARDRDHLRASAVGEEVRAVLVAAGLAATDATSASVVIRSHDTLEP